MIRFRRSRLPERAGLVLGLLILALLLVSLRWSVVWEGSSLTLALRMGSVYIWWGKFANANGWSIWSSWPYRDWWFDAISPRIGARHGWLPLWIPLALTAAVTAGLVWRRRHYFPPGTCRNCGYDLTGNVSGRCPECGAPA